MNARRLVSLVIIALFSVQMAGCPSQVWIPLEKSPRAAVVKGNVQFLDSPPTRPHVVIGIITPPAGAYETEAEAVKDMRGIAAKYGADAIYIESQSESGGWRFGSGWAGKLSGGSFSELRFRAKAIVWK
jgi:hypothetical protein